MTIRSMVSSDGVSNFATWSIHIKKRSLIPGKGFPSNLHHGAFLWLHPTFIAESSSFSSLCHFSSYIMILDYFLMIAPTACIPILSQTFPTPCLDVVGKYDFLFNSLKTDFFLFWIRSQDCCPTNLIPSCCQWIRRIVFSFLSFWICFWILADIF